MSINDPVTLADGTQAIFIGYQDDKRFGFFREAENPNTFFGQKISEIKQPEPQNPLAFTMDETDTMTKTDILISEALPSLENDVVCSATHYWNLAQHSRQTENVLAKITNQYQELKQSVHEFLQLMGIQEESDSGRAFFPNTIQSCRAHDLERIGILINRMEKQTCGADADN
jgi:hypothetical protein